MASNPTLTVDHLERLIADEDASVRATALAHPGLSTEQLARALASDRDGIRAIAIGHSLATEAQLLAAIEDDAEAVRQRAIGNPNCTRRVVEAFLRRPNAHEAATSPNLNAGDVDHLANDERSYRASAEHPAAGPSTLDRLARRHPDTLFRVARHPNTSIETLQWIEFESETGRGLTFANPNTPDHWRTAALVPGVAPEVVKRALWDAQDVGAVIAFLDRARNVHFDEAAIHDGIDPRVATSLYERHVTAVPDEWGSVWLLSVLIEQEDTPDEILAALIENPAALDSGVFVHLHDVMLSAPLVDLAADHPDSWIRSAAAGSCHATVAHLDRFIRDPAPTVRAAAAWNPAGNGDQAAIGLNDSEVSVRAAAAESDALPVELLPLAAADAEWRVRLGALTSENATAEFIATLRNDAHPKVRKEWKRFYRRARCWDVFETLGCRHCGRPYQHGASSCRCGGCCYIRI